MLTKKDVTWTWGIEQQQASELLKTCLLKPPILRYPDLTRDFIVDTDAFEFGLGSVLAKLEPDNGEEKEVVIVYTSKYLTGSQANWSM